MEGLHDRESPAIWHHGGLEHRCIGPWALVQRRMRRWLQLYGGVGIGDHRLPKRVESGELADAGKRGPRGEEK